MRTLHFDCFSGISGDMTVAALVDAGADRDAVLSAIASLNLPVQVEFRKEKRGGLAGTYFAVTAEKETKHRHLHHIEKIIGDPQLGEAVQSLAMKIFHRLAEAEAKVHGTTIEKVHFHEVGASDSIVDIVATAVAFHSLKIDYVTARSVPTGFGTVHCDHGAMPIPAPATAELLHGIPLASVKIEFELTTPTGASILASLVNDWTETPAVTIEKIGIGVGTKDFPKHANALRVFVGKHNIDEGDTVVVLETNLDDVSGEVIGYCTERVFHAGALDAYSIPIQMKKGRPGVLFGVIASPESVVAIEEVLFRETGTLGIRKHSCGRVKQQRREVVIESPWGTIHGKHAWRSNTAEHVSPEYEDCARIAREQNVPLVEILRWFSRRD